LFSAVFAFFDCCFFVVHMHHNPMPKWLRTYVKTAKLQTTNMFIYIYYIYIYIYIPSKLSHAKKKIQPVCTQTRMHSGSLEGEPPSNRTFPPYPTHAQKVIRFPPNFLIFQCCRVHCMGTQKPGKK
jgi:hypothetical protein